MLLDSKLQAQEPWFEMVPVTNSLPLIRSPGQGLCCFPAFAISSDLSISGPGVADCNNEYSCQVKGGSTAGFSL